MDSTIIRFIVDFKPNDFTITNANLNQCDDELDPKDQNGVFNFTSSAAIHSEILAAQPAGMNTTIKYFDNLGNPLSSPLPNPFVVTTSQTVTVVVENNDNLSCPLTKPIVFNVNPTPKIYLLGSELVCDDNLLFNVTLNAGLFDGSPESNYTYQWYLNGTSLTGETNYSHVDNRVGTYTVEVTNAFGCTKTRTITVDASNKAKIGNIDVVDLSDDNTITVNVTGDGDYVYSIDSEEGPYQESNIFYNVRANKYTVYVKDLKGCGISSKDVYVVGAPKYFTPNGDSYHDTWNLRGVGSNNANSEIFIFDRYGKLLQKITPSGPGWNGTFNGEEMPSDDYWYTLKLQDGRNIKGHFTLKR